MVWRPERFETFDFETSGRKEEYALQPWRVKTGDAWATSLVTMRLIDGSPVYGGGLLDSEDDPHDFARTKHMIKVFLEEALHAKRTLVGWNVVFDIAWLMAYGLEELALQCTYMDGMLLWRHAMIEPEYDLNRAHKKSFSLKQFVPDYLPEAAGYQDEIDFHDRTTAARKALHKYNKQDNLFTYIGTKHFYEQLEPQQLKAARIEACMLPLVARSNLRGMLIDTLASKDLAGRLVTSAATELDKLQWAGVTEQIVRSPIKLAALMYDEWKLPVLKENKSKLTGKTTRSTDKEVLHELSFEDERAKWLRRYREALNNKTKFADQLVKSAEYNEDNRAHPQAISFGTYTGRLTYSSNQSAKGPGKREGTEKKIILPTGFALHQMKGIKGGKDDHLFRSQVVAPDGYTLMEFDAAGQEYRWMAIQSGDPVMLHLCEPGEDPHSYMGSRIINVEYAEMIRLKETDKTMKMGRKGGKVANLSLQFRTSAPRLRVTARVDYDIPMTKPESELIWLTYQRTYVCVPIYWEKAIARVKRLGYAQTLAGRRVQVTGDWSGRDSWAMGSTAINYPIQGTGGDQKCLAIACVADYLPTIDSYFGWDLHDGLYFYVPNKHVKKAAVDIKRILDNLPYESAWGFSPPVPLPWDVKMGPSWGGLKDYHPD